MSKSVRAEVGQEARGNRMGWRSEDGGAQSWEERNTYTGAEDAR